MDGDVDVDVDGDVDVDVGAGRASTTVGPITNHLICASSHQPAYRQIVFDCFFKKL